MKKLTKTAVLLLILFLLPQSVSAATVLIPGGQVVGMELLDGSVSVVAFDSEENAARKAGLSVGDRILKIDRTAITCIADVKDALKRSDGIVSVTVLRGDQEKVLTLQPAVSEQGPRLGVYLKEGITGLGTVTFFDPQTNKIGALGHGVNDRTGQLIAMQKGTLYAARIFSVRKGASGTPGQILGSLDSSQPLGTMGKNCRQGVFGTLDTPQKGTPLPVGSAGDISESSATILCAVKDNCVQEYSVEILKIYPSSKCKDRNMLLQVTDPDLLKITGGIVQGMSGSPIIQNGKLIGAVTHVLVNDPTKGYGIFIENMLDAAA